MFEFFSKFSGSSLSIYTNLNTFFFTHLRPTELGNTDLCVETSFSMKHKQYKVYTICLCYTLYETTHTSRKPPAQVLREQQGII